MARGKTVVFQRLSWSRLHRYCLLHLQQEDPDTPGVTYSDIMRATGMSRAIIQRAACDGSIAFNAADTIACALGVHPSWIWGPEYWDALQVLVDDVEARGGLDRIERKRESARRYRASGSRTAQCA